MVVRFGDRDQGQSYDAPQLVGLRHVDYKWSFEFEFDFELTGNGPRHSDKHLFAGRGAGVKVGKY